MPHRAILYLAKASCSQETCLKLSSPSIQQQMVCASEPSLNFNVLMISCYFLNIPVMLYDHCDNLLSLLCKSLDFGCVSLAGRCIAVCYPYGHAILTRRICAVVSPQLSKSLGCKSWPAGRGSGKHLCVSAPSLHLLLLKRKIISAS